MMRRSRVLLAATALVLALTGCGATETPAATPNATKPTSAVATSAPTTAAAPTRYVDVKWWKITVKVLEKKCFGSAGCNVTYRIDPTYEGELDPSATYRVTYEVSGVEDGPAVNNFTVTGSQASLDSEERGSVKSTKTKLTAKATDMVEE